MFRYVVNNQSHVQFDKNKSWNLKKNSLLSRSLMMHAIGTTF